MARERELKLEIEPAAIPHIVEWVHGAGGGKKSGGKLHAIYFDTDDFALQHHGVSMRIRRSNDGFTQTIKCEDRGGAGLFDRPEFETSVQGFIPDFAAAEKTGLKPLQEHRLSRRLHPVFETDIRRTAFELPGLDGVALTLDRGRLIAGKRRARVCEIEIESLNGQLDGVFRTAKAIAAISPLRLSPQSKSSRGYALLQESQIRVVRAGHVSLAPAMPSEAAFRAIARDCVRQLIANVPATSKGDAEGLHQMRVGLRRLRAAISAFSEMLQNSETEQIKSNLKWLGQCLGGARDLDTLLDSLQHGPAKKSIPQSIRQRFEQRRRHTYADLRQVLSSARFRGLLLDILAWIECGNWSRTPANSMALLRVRPAAAHAASELGRRHKKLVKQLSGLKHVDPEERHHLRIRAKRLRYAVEFFADLFAGRKNSHHRDRLLSALKDLQSALGDLNDLISWDHLVAETLKPKTGRSTDGQMSPATVVALYRPDGGESSRLMRLATQAAHRIEEAKPFWN